MCVCVCVCACVCVCLCVCVRDLRFVISITHVCILTQEFCFEFKKVIYELKEHEEKQEKILNTQKT